MVVRPWTESKVTLWLSVEVELKRAVPKVDAHTHDAAAAEAGRLPRALRVVEHPARVRQPIRLAVSPQQGREPELSV